MINDGYIKKSDAETALLSLRKGYRRTEEKCAVDGCILEIQDLPTVEAVEVVNGNSLIPKWISVSDELPAQYRVVIGWTKFKEMGEVEHDGKKFVWANEETVPAFVTHWMPFPEPPKGEEK